ncbi:glycerophosphodiester phosphodiesterase family protein [Shimia sp. SDUM112013]|uniref:glycerophosphodiester phosphodiesterase family protein n=1 Tax=Shimia sp. SDUM112013 TaxID=3136160 RepID=UPI0032F0894A
MLDAVFLNVPLAHRALHDLSAGRPENSRAAIRAAVSAGYGIEIDLQLSADGHAMCFHDYDLGRLTGEKGPVQRRSAAELGQIQLTGGDEGIPSFAEVLDIVAGQVPLLVEIKDQDGLMGPNVGLLEQAAATDAQTYEGPLAFMSFNPNSVAALAEIAPQFARGLVTDAYSAEDWPILPPRVRDALRDIPDFERVGASFISQQASSLGLPQVADLKARGVPVLCWTIRSAEAEAKAREIADNVTFEGYLAEIPA